MRTFLLFIFVLTLINCGGGGGPVGGDDDDNGGGGDGGNTDSEGDKDYYPLLEPDPEYLGDAVEYDGATFTILSENGGTLSFESDGKSGQVYEFNEPIMSNGTQFVPLAMANGDAIISAGIVLNPDQFGEAEIFGYDGDWATSPVNKARYVGVYQSLSIDGVQHPDREILVQLDLDEIYRSTGYDLKGDEAVSFHFTGWKDGILTGTISDFNGYNHPSNFGLFGKTGTTMTGGYISEQGVGIFMGDTQ